MRLKRWAKVGLGVYQQAAAIIGAFAIAAFLSNLIDFDWRAGFRAILGVWDEYIRPPVSWLFHMLVTVPAEALGWHVEVPQAVRDYFSVGVVLFLSRLRAGRILFREPSDLDGNWPVRGVPNWAAGFVGASPDFRKNAWAIAVWPVSVAYHVVLVPFDSLRIRRTLQKDPPPSPMFGGFTIDPHEILYPAAIMMKPAARRRLRLAALTLAPVIYLCVLLAVNAVLPV